VVFTANEGGLCSDVSGGGGMTSWGKILRFALTNYLLVVSFTEGKVYR